MRRLLFCCGLLVIAAIAPAYAYPRPPEGTEDIPKLVMDSALVCKGEVKFAPPATQGQRATESTARAVVDMDRCFKGDASTATVLFDATFSGVDPAFVLRTGDYYLFFLKPKGEGYQIVDRWFGVLSISRKLSSGQLRSDPLLNLESDLIAGLEDSDPEQVRNSIRMLGNLKHVHSERALKALLASSDLLTKTYLWEALLRLKDYSIVPAVADFIASQPPVPHELILPRDRIAYMEGRIFGQIGTIRDPALLPYLQRLSKSPNQYLRMDVVDAVRAIGSLQGSQILVAELEDSNPDTAFAALQALLQLAGEYAGEWVPSFPQFRDSPSFYAAKCRNWWNTEGLQQAEKKSLEGNALR
jgi:hypothetical protein